MYSYLPSVVTTSINWCSALIAKCLNAKMLKRYIVVFLLTCQMF